MPTIEDRLRDTGRVWREHVDVTTPQPTSIPTPAEPHSRSPKRRVVLVAAAAVAVAVIGVPVAGVIAHRAANHNTSRGGFAASCAGPQLRLVDTTSFETKYTTPTLVHSGQSLTIYGRFYLDVCRDTNHALDPHPLTVDLSLRGHGRTVLLRTVRAHGELGTFRTTVRVPADYPLGTAKLTTRTSGPQAAAAEGSPMEPITLTIAK